MVDVLSRSQNSNTIIQTHDHAKDELKEKEDVMTIVQKSLDNDSIEKRNSKSNVHAEEQESKFEPELFNCELCNSVFVTNLSLTRHMLLTHENEPRIPCSLCKCQFYKEDDLAEHISNVHEESKKKDDNDEEDHGKPIVGKSLPEEVNYDNVIDETNAEFETFRDNVEEEEDEQMYLDEDSSELQAEPEENDYYSDDDKLVIAQLGYDIEEVEDYENEDYEDEQDQEEMMDFYDGGLEDTEIIQLNGGRSQQSQQRAANQFRYNNNSREFDPVTKINASLNGIRVERKHICQECGASFMSKVNLQRHMTIHCQIRPYKCDLCAKGFVRKEHLLKHLSSVHSGLKFTCEFCGKDISRKDHLIRHIRHVHPTDYLGIPPELIDAQNIESLSMSSLQAAGFTISDKALQSMQPKPKKPYLSCDMCDETFTQLNDLHEHQSDVHRDIRKYKCPDCPKAFKRKEHLTKHEVLHTGEKKFNCTICGKSFPRKDALHDHIRRMHGNGYVQCIEYPCNFCEKVFLQKTNLVRHLRNVHGLIVNMPHQITSQPTTIKTMSTTSGPPTTTTIIPTLKQRQSVPSQLQQASSSSWSSSSSRNYDSIPSLAEAQRQLDKISNGRSMVTISPVVMPQPTKPHPVVQSTSYQHPPINAINSYTQSNSNSIKIKIGKIGLVSNSQQLKSILSNPITPQRFSCTHCNVVFSDEKMYQIHLNTHRMMIQ